MKPAIDFDTVHDTRVAERRGEGFTLVLGGGGAPGAAYLIGALQALEETQLVDPAAAALTIGTSAGARVGALIATGVPIAELRTAVFVDEVDTMAARILDRAWSTNLELVRRTAGTSWVLGRSMLRLPWLSPPAFLRRWYRGGLYTLRDDRMADQFTAGWSTAPLWLTAVDLDSGRRVVLGHRDEDDVDLARAVAASMAVPGVFDPVRLGNRVLVDGGVHSTTHLDLARWAPHRHVICLAPMGFDPRSPPTIRHSVARAWINTQILRELATVRASGRHVALFRPDADVLALHGLNFLRPGDTDAIIAASRIATSRALSRPSTRKLLERIAAHDPTDHEHSLAVKEPR